MPARPRSSVPKGRSARSIAPSYSAIAGILRGQLLPNRMLNSKEYQAAQKYADNVRSKRLGRGPITDPKLFNNANNAAMAARRIAFKNYENPNFQKLLNGLPSPVRERVKDEYREIKHVSAAMRLIGNTHRLRHSKTPSAMNDDAFASHVRNVLASKIRKPVSLARVDLDFFRVVNNDFGHDVGDLVMERLTERYRQTISKRGDEFGRMGGEEFDMFHQETPTQLKQRLDRFRIQFMRETSSPSFRAQVRALLPYDMSEAKKSAVMKTWKPISFTAGVIGYSSYTGKAGYEWMNRAADHLMKRTKKAGRGRTMSTSLR